MMKPASRAKYVPTIPAEVPTIQDDPEPEFVEPPTPGLPSLFDVLAAELEDDDDFIMITNDVESSDLENNDENSSKRRKTS